LEYNKPIKVGQSSNEGSQAGTIYNNKGISPTISAGTHGYAIGLVLVSPKLTNTQSKSTKPTSPVIRSTAMYQKLHGMMSKILTSWWADFLANPFRLLVSVKGLTTSEVHCFLKSLGLHRKNSHAFYCLKMLRGFYLTTKGRPSELSSIRWMNLGMTCSGKCLTVKTSVFPRTGKECSLSDILEEHVDPKYFLSSAATATLFREIQKQRNSLPIQLPENTEQATPEEPTSQQ